jgi:hypothetical protein
MSTPRWVDVGEPGSDGWSTVSLWLPCPGDHCVGGGWRFCCHEKRQHGHIALDTEDGLGVVPVSIFSRPFFEAVCRHLGQAHTISDAEMNALLSLPEAQDLENELNDTEKGILADSDAMNIMTRFGFVGA